jgi:hypothetical protein
MGTNEDNPAGEAASQGRRTLAERIEWLIQHNWPAEAPLRTNDDIAAAITAATGEEISGTGFWKLRTGRGANPTLKTLMSFSQFFDVPIGFFSGDPADAEEVGDEMAMVVLLRQKGVTRLQLRSFADCPARVGRRSLT